MILVSLPLTTVLCWPLWAATISPAVATAATAPASVVATPTPTPVPVKPVTELEPLQFLVGDWLHEKELAHEGVVGRALPGSGRSKASWILEGHDLFVVYRSKRSDGEYEGRGLVSWDAAGDRYRLTWFDDEGHVRELAGKIDPTGVLAFTGELVENGRTVRQTISVKKQTGKILILDERAVDDGKPALFFESLASPAPATPPPATPTSPCPVPTTASPPRPGATKSSDGAKLDTRRPSPL